MQISFEKKAKKGRNSEVGAPSLVGTGSLGKILVQRLIGGVPSILFEMERVIILMSIVNSVFGQRGRRFAGRSICRTQNGLRPAVGVHGPL